MPDDETSACLERFMTEFMSNSRYQAALRSTYNLFVPQPNRIVYVLSATHAAPVWRALDALLGGEPYATMAARAAAAHRVLDAFDDVKLAPFDEVYAMSDARMCSTLTAHAERMNWTTDVCTTVGMQRDDGMMCVRTAVAYARMPDTSAFPSSTIIVERLRVDVADVEVAVVPERCDACGKHATAMCGRCYRVCYCSRECQRARYAEHKKACRAETREVVLM